MSIYLKQGRTVFTSDLKHTLPQPSSMCTLIQLSMTSCNALYATLLSVMLQSLIYGVTYPYDVTQPGL